MKNDTAVAKKCKKLCVIALLLSAALLLFPASVFAHAGKTDANGGHFDLSTGEYHYHHGFPAHQHTDGYCPYNFEDETEYGGGGFTGNTISSSREYTASDLREASKEAYDDGYGLGYRVGKTDGYGIGYDDGLEDGEETGYQSGLEDGRKNQFQYYPLVIASISVIAGIVILALTANRHKLKEDLTDQISSGKRKLRDLEEELQLEMDKSKRDFNAMKNSYQNELDRAAQRFNQLQSSYQNEIEKSKQGYSQLHTLYQQTLNESTKRINELKSRHQKELETTNQRYAQLQSSYQNEIKESKQGASLLQELYDKSSNEVNLKINELKSQHQKELGHIRGQLYDCEKKYEQALIQIEEITKKANQAIISYQSAKYSADQRVKSCEQFIAMFGGSAEEFFARQDAPERLAKMQADYLTLVYEASAIYLENKQRPAYKEAQRIRELKADTARYIERMKKAEYECDQLREQLRITKKVYSVSDHTET